MVLPGLIHGVSLFRVFIENLEQADWNFRIFFRKKKQGGKR